MKARIPGAPQGGGNMMKQLQQMQEDVAKVQEEVEASEFNASSGGGMVEVVVNGKHEILSIKINPDIVEKDDVEMLEDFVMIAANEALKKASEAMEKGMEAAQGGLSIPGLF